MDENFHIQRARKRLAEWEGLFEKYSNVHNGWTPTYKEYFVIKNTQYDSPYFLEHLNQQSADYPLSQHYLNNVWLSLQAGISSYAPKYVQESVYQLARLALQIYLKYQKSDVEVYIEKAKNITCGSLVLRYFREAVDAHKQFANYLSYGHQDTKLIKSAAKILSGVSSEPASGSRDLASLAKLKLAVSLPSYFKVEQLIQGDENHFVEFKAAVTDNPQREEDKDAITKKRLEEVVAFLNSGKGHLIVGVEDKSRSVHGIEYEVDTLFGGDTDEYDLHWSKAVRDRIAVAFSPDGDRKTGLVTQDTVYRESIDLNGHTVYMFTCQRKNEESLYFLKTKKKYEFHVRNNNGKQKILLDDLDWFLKESGRL